MENTGKCRICGFKEVVCVWGGVGGVVGTCVEAKS